MLNTFLTRNWQLRYPVIGAPMAYVGKGRLAHAISEAGGLGILGIGSKNTVEFVAEECAVARGNGDTRFGVGLMAWSLDSRPELLEAVMREKPFLISVSFGSAARYVEIIRSNGIRVATQVHSRGEALQVERAGVDLIVVQGTEAGGHTGHVGTLPLLQTVLDAVQVPVVAAGGIASPRGVAAALAAGAQGVWVGTVFLACPECDNSPAARERVIQAQESDTILTRVFDIAQNIPWPTEYPGRAITNRFAERWHAKPDALANDAPARAELADAIKRKDYDTAYIYAGQGVGLVTREQPASAVVRALGEGAEELLKARSQALLGNQ